MLCLSCRPTKFAITTLAVIMIPYIISVNELSLWTVTAVNVEPITISHVSEKAVHVHG